jgi:hypothetical protein
MSVEAVVKRSMADPELAERIKDGDESLLDETGLSAEELETLASGDEGELRQLLSGGT